MSKSDGSNKKDIYMTDWLSDKLNLSLTLKLNFRNTVAIAKAFFKFNIIFILVLVILLMFFADRNILDVKKRVLETKIDIDKVSEIPTFTTNLYIKSLNNFQNKDASQNRYIYLEKLYGFINKNPEDVKTRMIVLVPGDYYLNFEELEYVIVFDDMVIGYNFLNLYNNFFIFLMFMLIFEFLLILNQLLKNSKSIRQSLNPIKELTETVKDINGSDLSKRISIVGTQNEFVDLTQEINAMLNRIQESYEAQSRFVSDASHELRTPIAVIQGYANLLSRWGKEDPETLVESIDAIESETASMKTLVEQLLFLARGDRENLNATKKEVELSAVIEEIFNECKVIDKEHIYELRPLEIAKIKGDSNLIKQAIRIFVDNARKYTEADKKIRIGVTKENNNAVIIIEDEGVGMSPYEITHMFERFFRADKSRNRKDGGSGLGLSIADQILKLHNAKIDVVSLENFGTKISLSVPIIKEEKKIILPEYEKSLSKAV